MAGYDGDEHLQIPEASTLAIANALRRIQASWPAMRDAIISRKIVDDAFFHASKHQMRAQELQVELDELDEQPDPLSRHIQGAKRKRMAELQYQINEELDAAADLELRAAAIGPDSAELQDAFDGLDRELSVVVDELIKCSKTSDFLESRLRLLQHSRSRLDLAKLRLPACLSAERVARDVVDMAITARDRLTAAMTAPAPMSPVSPVGTTAWEKVEEVARLGSAVMSPVGKGGVEVPLMGAEARDGRLGGETVEKALAAANYTLETLRTKTELMYDLGHDFLPPLPRTPRDSAFSSPVTSPRLHPEILKTAPLSPASARATLRRLDTVVAAHEGCLGILARQIRLHREEAVAYRGTVRKAAREVWEAVVVGGVGDEEWGREVKDFVEEMALVVPAFRFIEAEKFNEIGNRKFQDLGQMLLATRCKKTPIRSILPRFAVYPLFLSLSTLAPSPAMATTPGSLNVYGRPLQPCSTSPMTGFFRDGFCHTCAQDTGSHTVCARVTTEFLEFSKRRGNDLTRAVGTHFPGLKEGDFWCLCAGRWKEAQEAGVAPPVWLEATNAGCLDVVELEVLEEHSLVKVDASSSKKGDKDEL
ncbi:hypothetical protein HDU96_010308 [Phlyctochytrium bullatum]|nr:hypothetical protein HDU96_010308 [Phlyctochytrium bullatum]